jgi:actin related protein 2/3 complex subunit 3
MDFFKANVLFRNFEVEGPADRLLIYVTLYIHQCLCTMKGKSKAEATKLLFTQALSNFALPGEGKFPLGGMVSAPERQDAGTLLISILF